MSKLNNQKKALNKQYISVRQSTLDENDITDNHFKNKLLSSGEKNSNNFDTKDDD